MVGEGRDIGSAFWCLGEHVDPAAAADDTAPAAARIVIEPVGYKEYYWKPQAPELYSRAEVMRQTGPYLATVTPSVVPWRPIFTAEDTADIEDATRQLVEFDKGK